MYLYIYLLKTVSVDLGRFYLSNESLSWVERKFSSPDVRMVKASFVNDFVRFGHFRRS